jgi:Ca2+-binding RTX toxin-like protein
MAGRTAPRALDDAALDAVTGGAGSENRSGTASADTIAPSLWDRPLVADGKAGNDVIEGTSFGDQLTGGAGRDDLSGRDGNDVIWGDGWDPSSGDADSIYGGFGNDTVFAGGGNDLVVGGEGNDMIFGGAGDDTLIGSKGADAIYAGAGDDVVLWTPGEGSDLLVGDDGTDTLRLEATGLSLEQIAGMLRYDGWPATPPTVVQEAGSGKSYLLVGGLENVTLALPAIGGQPAATLTLAGFERIEVTGRALSVFDR